MQTNPVNIGKPDRSCKLVKNGGTNAINIGEPVAYLMTGTDDGVLVAASNDALVTATRATSLFAGIALQTIPVGGTGLVRNHGLCKAKITTDGTNAIAVGTTLTVSVANPVLAWSAAGSALPAKAMIAAAGTLAISQTAVLTQVYVNAL